MSKYLVTTLLVILSFGALSQRYGKNYPDFERKKFHFGTALGGTSTRYIYELKPNYSQFDSVISINIKSGPGFAIHLPLISYNPTATFQIRTIPSLTFHETAFEYTYWKKGKRATRMTRTQPTLINFPLLFKINTRRINNFTAYGITGFSYSYDLASQMDVVQQDLDPIIKLKKHDYAYHVGGGFDFYLPYFKFGIELKLTNGIHNILIKDDTFYSSPLNSLKTQVWWFSITFEG